MNSWTAWRGTRALTFLHERVRQILLAQGVEDHQIDYDGHPVHVYAAGPLTSTRTVVLLHGLGDSANTWFRMLPFLAWRGDRVLAIDLPGHGLSPPHDDRGFLPVAEHAEVIKHVVGELAVGDELDIVGHSLGGWVAARAHLAGLDVRRLVLVEAAGLEHEGIWESIEMLRIEHEEDVMRFFKTVCHHPPFGLSLVAQEVAAMFRQPAVVNFIDADGPDDFIPDDDLERVTAKTTIIWGEEDGLMPPILAHRWHAGVPDSDLIWIPKCGHTPQFERPLMFQRLVEEALGHPPMRDFLRARLMAHVPLALRRHLVRAST